MRTNDLANQIRNHAKRFVSRLPLVLTLVLVSTTVGCRPGTTYLSGTVTDCESGAPVGNVTIRLRYRGWGLDGLQPVWDKDFETAGTSDQSGSFRFASSARNGRGTLTASAQTGYLTASQFTSSRTPLAIRLLKDDGSGEVTYDCRRQSECLVCGLVNGVRVCRNVCLGQ